MMREDAGEGADPDRWLWVQSEGSGDGYKDMAWFIEHLEDAGMAERLAVAITGREAFRRFKGTLSQWSDLMTRWHDFFAERQRGRARQGLAAHGYRPAPPQI